MDDLPSRTRDVPCDGGAARAAADWDALVAFGLPLAWSPGAAPKVEPAELPGLVRRAARELAAAGTSGDVERKRDALQALILGLRLHFPSAYRRCRRGCSEVGALLPSQPSGRAIKLARIAARGLSEVV